MESLQEILAAKHRAAMARERDILRLEKRKRSEETLKELEEKNRLVCLRNTLSQWKDLYFFPWKKQAKIISRFIHWIHFWKKSPKSGEISFQCNGDSDEEIQENTRRQYQLSLERDQAIENIPIVYWVNTRGLVLDENMTLEEYIGRFITISNFNSLMQEWKSLPRFLYWIKVHQNAKNGYPNWIGRNVLDIAFGHIENLSLEIPRYEKYQCPHCDGMFSLSDLVDFQDYKICFICQTTTNIINQFEPMGECMICNNLANVREYDSLNICEICARREGIYEVSSTERVSCPGCNGRYALEDMIERSGIHLCQLCESIAPSPPPMEEDDDEETE